MRALLRPGRTPARARSFGRLGVALVALLGLFACSGPVTPPIEEPEKVRLSLVARADRTAVDLVVDSPVTLSALQVVVTFDPQQIGAGPAAAGPDAENVGLVFDDAARVPGRLLVGLADPNQNPLPRSGAVARVALSNASAGVALGLADAVAVDLFGKRVEVELEGATVP